MATTVAFDIIAKDRASDKFDKVGNSADRSSGKLKKFAKVGILAVGAAAVVAGKALWEMTKNAAEDEAAQRRLAIGLKNSANATDAQVASVEKWISAQSVALGVTDDELRPALQRLVQATGDVDEAQRQLSIAMDVSAGTGKSLKTVSEAMMKANNGSTAALSKLGLKTKDAEGKTMSYSAALKDMARTFKGQASAGADTLDGKMRRLGIVWDEAKESIGAKLIPVVTKLVSWFLKLSSGSSGTGDAMRKVGSAFGAVGGWIKSSLLPALSSLWKSAGPGVKEVFSAIGGVLRDSGPLWRLLGNIIANVLVPVMGRLAKTILPQVAAGLRGMGKFLRAVGVAGTWMWNNALQPVFSFLSKAIGHTLTYFGKMLQKMGEVPGFGWVGRLGDKMVDTGSKANRLGDSIKKIPVDRNIKFSTNAPAVDAQIQNLRRALTAIPDENVYIRMRQIGFAGQRGNALDAKANARGDSHSSGGVRWVGEEGPEKVILPRGARVLPAEQSRGGGMDYDALARALVRALRNGLPIVQLPDAGRDAYRRGASYA